MSDIEKLVQRYPVTTVMVVTFALISGIYFGGMALLPSCATDLACSH